MTAQYIYSFTPIAQSPFLRSLLSSPCGEERDTQLTLARLERGSGGELRAAAALEHRPVLEHGRRALDAALLGERR